MFPSQLDKDFSTGNGNQALYKTSEQGNLGDNKLLPYNFDYNLPPQNPWNVNLSNIKNANQPVERTNKSTPTFPDENTTPNFTNYGKRRFNEQGEKDDMEASSKKVKAAPAGLGGGDSRQKQTQMQSVLSDNENRPIQANFSNVSGNVPFNVKEEGIFNNF